MVKSIVFALHAIFAMLAIQPAGAHAYDIKGLHPGLELSKVRALYKDGVQGDKSLQLACMGDPLIAETTSVSTKKQREIEKAAGTETCYVIDVKPSKGQRWSQATFSVDGVEMFMELYFVAPGANNPLLAVISLSPAPESDDRDIVDAVTAELGQPRNEKRKFWYSSELMFAEEVPVWAVDGYDVVVRGGRQIFFYSPALSAELVMIGEKLPYGASFAPIPK